MNGGRSIEGSRQAEGAAQTRHRLLQAAESLVVREGVHALTVRRIASEAQVNSALVRYHFGGVPGLLRELALLNARRLADERASLLERLPPDDFDAAVDALVLPLWTRSAIGGDERAIVVLDEIFARATPELHGEIWTIFAPGVDRVTGALQAIQPGVDTVTLAWRIRFVTAAALDVPPRSNRSAVEARRARTYGTEQAGERLERFRAFARHALRA
ncbi:TetR family transcriptional regulator [Novosphingobium sp. ZN18A2]|uniref:TetR family transcriptional regulator n=1 Tax=Novosphingobium sp. ZN18A2 TaxID=3079861 RepID=UPI0030CE6F19